MRTKLLGVVLAGLLSTTAAWAQNTSALYKNYQDANANALYSKNYANSISNPTRSLNPGGLATKTLSQGRFSFRDVFARIPTPTLSTEFGPTAVPDPANGAQYLKAFGFKRFNTR